MKKTALMFFAACALLAGPALAAVPQSPLPPIRSDQALANKGQNVTVEGVASTHTDSRLGSYIDLDGKWPNTHFSAYIPSGNEHQFPPLASFEGRVVDVTGTVAIRRSIPTIIITDASQLHVR